MAKAKTRVQLESAKLLKEAGYRIPQELIDLIQKAEWERTGVVQVFRCDKCEFQLEQYVPTKTVHCPKDHLMKKVWELMRS